ncbi:MAG: hypothetical protein ACO2OZ_10305 [Acidilobaceae archaeon]
MPTAGPEPLGDDVAPMRGSQAVRGSPGLGVEPSPFKGGELSA